MLSGPVLKPAPAEPAKALPSRLYPGFGAEVDAFGITETCRFGPHPGLLGGKAQMAFLALIWQGNAT